MENLSYLFPFLIIIVIAGFVLREVWRAVLAVTQILIPVVIIGFFLLLFFALQPRAGLIGSSAPAPSWSAVGTSPPSERPPDQERDSRYVNSGPGQPTDADAISSPKEKTLKTPTNFRWDDDGSPSTGEIRYFENEEEIIIRIPRDQYEVSMQERAVL